MADKYLKNRNLKISEYGIRNSDINVLPHNWDLPQKCTTSEMHRDVWIIVVSFLNQFRYQISAIEGVRIIMRIIITFPSEVSSPGPHVDVVVNCVQIVFKLRRIGLGAASWG
jgi:hypothetical protein